MSRTTDKYVKIKKLSETAPENEIRIKAIPQIGRYISYAASLLLEKKMDTVLIKASGNAAKNACQIAEILRHRISGLHQLNALKTISVTDEYEPREEGLEKVVMERKLAVLEISLSLKNGVLDSKAPGYQAPLPPEEVQEEELKSILEGRRRPFTGGRPERGDREEREERGERGERGDRGGFRRGRYAGPRGRGRAGGRGGYGGGRRDYEDDREERGGRGYGGGRREGGGRDYDDREGGERRRGGGGRGGYGGGSYGGGSYGGGSYGGGRGYDDREERRERGGFRGGGRGGYRGGRY